MPFKLAFAGFRHGHIQSLYKLASARADVEVVAACEEHGPTREQLRKAGTVRLTHDSYDAMYRDGGFDAVAVGDYYGRRGEVILRTLEAGRHAIVDKPLCTRLEELDRIEKTAAARGLSVGCMLTSRDGGHLLRVRELIAAGTIGPVHTITFSGQHPLLAGSRPAWYFEPDKQGGTINDIAIHAMDAIPWMTGRRLVEVVAARVWNCRARPDWFQDGAQLMLRMDNGGGVLGDVSYLAPDSCGYKQNVYWRYTFHGELGQLETAANDPQITLYTDAGGGPKKIDPLPGTPGGYFDAFLGEIAGRKGLTLTTAEVIAAARISLLTQQAADRNRFNVPLA
ncbi:MAG: Inositol 2-dehydrogenase/D-chiro-inositol 3-dehydrogenase [Phycisphaerae bacterium]|nr:Inositol 2-dehydrogenase/D-chiro-inositol 3-dehydrogenase [Phycisphaerae bacterium]